MIIHARKGLEGLTKDVEIELATALEERAKMGLSVPADFTTEISFYGHQDSLACAKLDENGAKIIVNATSAIYKMAPEDQVKLQKVTRYFDIVRDLLGECTEDKIFAILDNPVGEIESHESSVFSEPILSNRKTFFKERGREYDFYKNMVISDSKSTKELIDELLPKIVNVFDSSSLSLMRHELDHIDFFSSPFYIAHNAMSKKLKDLSHKLNDLKDTSVSEEFAQLNLKNLKQNSELVPILEGRALFFTYTPIGKFGEIGFSRIRERVAKHIREGYIDKTYSHVIVDALISLAWSQGRMNRQTSNYLFQKITSLTGHPSSSRYVVDEEKVDYEQVFRIYHEELPKLMDVFRLNTDLAVDAIYHAYRYNPARLNEAKSATDFPGFMKIMSKIDYNLKIPL